MRTAELITIHLWSTRSAVKKILFLFIVFKSTTFSPRILINVNWFKSQSSNQCTPQCHFNQLSACNNKAFIKCRISSKLFRGIVHCWLIAMKYFILLGASYIDNNNKINIYDTIIILVGFYAAFEWLLGRHSIQLQLGWWKPGLLSSWGESWGLQEYPLRLSYVVLLFGHHVHSGWHVLYSLEFMQ